MSSASGKSENGNRAGQTFIGAWIPASEVVQIDRAVQLLDLDRSKFLRRALRDQIERILGTRIVGGARKTQPPPSPFEHAKPGPKQK